MATIRKRGGKFQAIVRRGLGQGSKWKWLAKTFSNGQMLNTGAIRVIYCYSDC